MTCPPRLSGAAWGCSLAGRSLPNGCPMAVLTNPKHELFAQGLAKGLTQVEAYERAGYQPTPESASRLLTNAKVSARVAELQERAAARVEITVAGLTERLLRLATMAESLGDAPGAQASRASLMDAAKLNGLITDKSAVDLRGQLDAELNVKLVRPGGR